MLACSCPALGHALHIWPVMPTDAMGLRAFGSARNQDTCQWCCRSRTAVAPLERLKILMQVQGKDKVYTGVWQVSSAQPSRLCFLLAVASVPGQAFKYIKQHTKYTTCL